MADPRTQKQIAEKYKGNLDYFRKPRGMRVWRLFLFILAGGSSLAAVFGFRHYGGKPEFYNTGPLSANHAQFADRCEVCHEQARTDLVEVLKLDVALARLRNAAWPGQEAFLHQTRATLAKVGDKAANAPARLEALTGQILAHGRSLSHMDAACIKCHDAFQLHQPQAAAVALRPVSREIGLVHASGCSICHREHQGPSGMSMPASDTCASCHGQRQQLLRTLTLIKAEGPYVSPRAEIRDLGDGVRRFIPPRPVPHEPHAFTTFAQGHPPFGYENPKLKDPAVIRYNHARHEQPDIPKLNGRKLDCADCHRPGADGIFYQKVSYDQHCVTCHSLHFDPDVPKLAIPHGDPEKVRAFLRSLASQYADYAVNERKVTDRAQLKLFVDTQLGALQKRGITTAAELENRVFFTGDPPQNPGRISVRSNKAQYFPGCAKCHEVQPPPLASGVPRIAATNVAERWLTRGPFTHAPHAHMDCMECHAEGETSSKTSDIIMPSQASCAECHRASTAGSLVTPTGATAPGAKGSGLSDRQRAEGGIASDCQSCHDFHAPLDPGILKLVESVKP